MSYVVLSPRYFPQPFITLRKVCGKLHWLTFDVVFQRSKQASVHDVSKVFHFFEKMEDPGNEFGKCVNSVIFSGHSPSVFL